MKPDLLNVSRDLGLDLPREHATPCIATPRAVSFLRQGLTADFQMAKVNYRQ